MNTMIPMTFTDTELREMPDVKLETMTRGLKNKIEILRRKGIDTRNFEVEYCYVKRELEFRNKRKETQEAYAQQKARYVLHRRRPAQDNRVVAIGPNEIAVNQ